MVEYHLVTRVSLSFAEASDIPKVRMLTILRLTDFANFSSLRNLFLNLQLLTRKVVLALLSAKEWGQIIYEKYYFGHTRNDTGRSGNYCKARGQG